MLSEFFDDKDFNRLDQEQVTNLLEKYTVALQYEENVDPKPSLKLLPLF